jgi:hypothetical protein
LLWAPAGRSLLFLASSLIVAGVHAEDAIVEQQSPFDGILGCRRQ